MPRVHSTGTGRQHLKGRDASASTASEDGRTYDDLYDEAKRRDIAGRSKMSKSELERALAGR